MPDPVHYKVRGKCACGLMKCPDLSLIEVQESLRLGIRRRMTIVIVEGVAIVVLAVATILLAVALVYVEYRS